ncbi:MAG: hypothetical protein ACK4OF_08025 [Aquificaceae bacterium]
MNILIVSFDKALVGKLKEVLKEYNIIDVKNVEEALSAASPFIDVVIYDAVAGSISEDEINQLYKQKYKDAKYVILVDDLFPVDMKNILPPEKLKLMREEAAEKIKEAILKEEAPKEAEPSLESLLPSFEIESSSLSLPQALPQEEAPFSFGELPLSLGEEGLSLEKEPIPPSFEEKTQAVKGANKVLVVSFDTDIIRNLNQALSDRVQILEAKTPKEAMGKVKDADIVIFDTISGMLAYRTLMDMSRDEELSKKPFILLMDELFTIDVDSIPIAKKYTFARTTELSKVIQKVIELTEKTLPLETAAPIPSEPLPIPEVEDIAKDLLEGLTATQEMTPQEEPVKDILEEILSGSLQEEKEPVFQKKPQEDFPAKAIKELTQKAPKEEFPSEAINMENITSLIQEAIKDQLSQEKLYSILSQVINPQDLRNLIEQKVQEALSKVDIAQIIREEAYKVLKERLRELIT